MRLYHWTCGHAAERIRDDGGLLRPNPLLELRLLWMTDLGPDALDGAEDRDAFAYSLGLQSTILTCDRLETCWHVPDPDLVVAWDRLVPELIVLGYGDLVTGLTLGRDHARWFVTTRPKRAERVR